MLKTEKNMRCDFPTPDNSQDPIIPDGEPDGACEYLGVVKWTRFGEITTQRWDKRRNSWYYM